MSKTLDEIQDHIKDAQAVSSVREVTIIGASKTVSPLRLRPFVEAGLKDLGENYVQEGITKVQELQDLDICWHFIGALQSNKARLAVTNFTWIHSVDRVSLLNAIDKAARAAGKTPKVLLQVNVGNEQSKAGCAISDLNALAEACLQKTHLQLCGLMCLPPMSENAQDTRKYFSLLRELGEKLQLTFSLDQIELSMGMSHDYIVAIEEGATMVRLGRVLFGERAG